jgi:tetratricopeptide (TPR) repeat protein
MKRLAPVACLFSLALGMSCSGITCSQNRHRAIRYMNMGVKKFTDGLHAPALRDLKAAVREDDTFAKAHYNLAMVYQQMKQWDDAQRHLNRVITLEPNVATYHYELGKCYQYLNRIDMAKSSYEKALSLNPNLYVVHFRLGTVFMALDQPKEADSALRRAIEINPRFTKAFVSLSLLYLNYDYPELAMQVLQAGVAINDNSAEAHNMLGVSQQMLKQYDKAVDSFKKALVLENDYYVAMFNLGMALAAADKRKEAEEILTRFTKAAVGKADIDADYVREANEKLAELSGVMEGPSGGAGQDALPDRKPE